MTRPFAPALAGLLLSTAAFAAEPLPPQPKIVVLDKSAIMQFSKVGRDVARQVQEDMVQARHDLEGRGKALQAEQRTLQQQVAILAPDVKQKRMAEFQSKAQALQGEAQKKDTQIKAGFYQARQAMEQALGPILQEIIKARGANIVVDKQAVVMATTSGFDVTSDVIKALDQKMPTYKVNLNAPVPPQLAGQKSAPE